MIRNTLIALASVSIFVAPALATRWRTVQAPDYRAAYNKCDRLVAADEYLDSVTRAKGENNLWSCEIKKLEIK